jgi:hypothetical protein
MSAILPPPPPLSTLLYWVGSGPRHDIGVSLPRGRDSTTCCPSCYRPILRSQVSALRSQVQVFGTRFRFRPAPVPEPDSPYPPPDCRDLRPETIQHLKGKPETGINASVICPQLTIRSPYAAPFEFCLSLVLRASSLYRCIPCPLVNLSTGQLVAFLANWPTGQPIN